MAFWIFIGIILTVLAVSAVTGLILEKSRHYYYDWWSAFGTGLMVAVVVAIVGLFVVIAGTGGQTMHGNATRMEHRYSLRALVTKDETESHAEFSFFLGFGGGSAASGTTKYVSYIQVAKDGGSTLQKTTIGRTVIYEDVPKDGKPYVEDWVSYGKNDGAFWPWPFTWTVDGEAQHRFHIPKGTILEQYEVTP